MKYKKCADEATESCWILGINHTHNRQFLHKAIEWDAFPTRVLIESPAVILIASF